MRLLLLAGIILTASCFKQKEQEMFSPPRGERLSLASPLGLPPVPFPADNPPTRATVELGEQLFLSPVLSVDGTRSCATCHQPDNAFAEAIAVSTGVAKRKGRRNAPTLLNAAFFAPQFHDGRAMGLEAQARGPMLNQLEMAHTQESLAAALRKSPWPERFRKAFGEGEPNLTKATQALAAYERTLLSGNSPFDRFYFGKDPKALSERAQRGWEVFRNPQRGNCLVCHTVANDFALFSDQQFHNLGAGMNAQGELTDLGRYEVTKREADKGAFRTPTLRNVALTAPYMHDGSLKTLKEVIDFYIAGGNANDQLDANLKPLTLSAEERADLLAFLESLTGEMP
ncbi:MAG: cytochrome c peroxidase [Bryobacter sp.]